ncbi:MAG: agglutinin biogenesis protein MshP [Nitrosomonadales bacterium]|nr:agglutinin biogenesis protein MshP [Nitrosomonadales bacterium]
MTGKYKQRGFSLVSAIFLLVVLAGLGAAMVTFSTSQHQSQALDVLGSRAYQAAHAGVEWAAYNIASSPGVAGANNFGPVSGNPLGGNLDGFEVSVVYTAASQVDDTTYPPDGVTGTVWSYDITASAVQGTAGTENYVERVIKAKM